MFRELNKRKITIIDELYKNYNKTILETKNLQTLKLKLELKYHCCPPKVWLQTSSSA